MNKASKIILLFIISICVLCSCEKNDTTQSQKPQIVVTGFAQYDLVKQVTGDNAHITMLISPGAEVHTYEPTPKDIMALSKCDLFVFTGGVSDSWVTGLLDSADNKDLMVLSFMEVCELLSEQLSEGMEPHSHHDKEALYEGFDEHVWTSTSNAALISNAVCDALCEIDSKNSSLYQANRDGFISKLDKLTSQFRDMLQNAKRSSIVVGDRFPFLYLAKQFGIEYFAAFPGCASNTEPSAATIMLLSDKIKEQQLPVVFTVDFSNGKIASSLSEKTGAEVLRLYSCHNVTKEQFDNGETYITLMEKNLENLRKALN